MHSDSPWKQIGRAVVDLLCSWWRVDRIRIPSGEGGLLRIQPPSLISIDGRPMEIVGRTVGQTPAGAYIHYDCQTAHGAAQLQVRVIASSRPLQVILIEADQKHCIAEDEVEIWGTISKRVES